MNQKAELTCILILHSSLFILHLNLPMHLVTLNVDCAERTRRTQVLARSAAYAAGLVDNRYLRRLLVLGV